MNYNKFVHIKLNGLATIVWKFTYYTKVGIKKLQFISSMCPHWLAMLFLITILLSPYLHCLTVCEWLTGGTKGLTTVRKVSLLRTVTWARIFIHLQTLNKDLKGMNKMALNIILLKSMTSSKYLKVQTQRCSHFHRPVVELFLKYQQRPSTPGALKHSTVDKHYHPWSESYTSFLLQPWRKPTSF